jgi:hypothetical protein
LKEKPYQTYYTKHKKEEILSCNHEINLIKIFSLQFANFLADPHREREVEQNDYPIIVREWGEWGAVGREVCIAKSRSVENE